MNALDRLNQQVRDLSVRFIDVEDSIDDRGLLQQLRYLGPHCLPSQGVVGKIQPSSKPPGNLSARQLYDRILAESGSWVHTLSGNPVRAGKELRALALLPELARQRTERRDQDSDLLHGAEGLYRHAGRWHLSARIAMGYDRPSHPYPLATCPECGVRDPKKGGTLRARDTIHGLHVFCSNRECKDERGQRTEFSLPYLRMMLREAALARFTETITVGA